MPATIHSALIVPTLRVGMRYLALRAGVVERRCENRTPERPGGRAHAERGCDQRGQGGVRHFDWLSANGLGEAGYCRSGPCPRSFVAGGRSLKSSAMGLGALYDAYVKCYFEPVSDRAKNRGEIVHAGVAAGR